jgi:hypothetical protein
MALRYFGMGGGSIKYAPPGALEKVNIGLTGEQISRRIIKSM